MNQSIIRVILNDDDQTRTLTAASALAAPGQTILIETYQPPKPCTPNNGSEALAARYPWFREDLQFKGVAKRKAIAQQWAALLHALRAEAARRGRAA